MSHGEDMRLYIKASPKNKQNLKMLAFFSKTKDHPIRATISGRETI